MCRVWQSVCLFVCVPYRLHIGVDARSAQHSSHRVYRTNIYCFIQGCRLSLCLFNMSGTHTRRQLAGQGVGTVQTHFANFDSDNSIDVATATAIYCTLYCFSVSTTTTLAYRINNSSTVICC